MYLQVVTTAVVVSSVLLLCGCQTAMDSTPEKPIVTSETTMCPLWYYYNTSLQSCQCLPFLTCNGSNAYLDSDHILTYSDDDHTISLYPSIQTLLLGQNQSIPGYNLLPDNISEVNDFMCEPFNRKGYLCGQCFQGYGPSANMMINTSQCYDCSQYEGQGVLLYLAIEFIPVTIFYFILLVFQIKLANAPFTCFVMYSQLVVLQSHVSTSSERCQLCQALLKDTGYLTPVGKSILTLYGMFNLNFLHDFLPPFCISSHLRSSHIIIIGYISAFYPMLLIALTWLCIQLRDRNCKVIVILWKPFQRCAFQLRRTWNTKSDLVDVFASFFLLSYTKIWYQTYLWSSTREIHTYSLKDSEYSGPRRSYIMEFDNSMQVDDHNSMYIIGVFIIALIATVFSILPVVFMALYPVKCFRKVLSKCKLDRLFITLFLDKFYASYRDGLGGGRDMRSCAAFYFFLRIIVVAVPCGIRDILSVQENLIRGVMFSATSLVVALCRPYKRTYLNVCDALLLLHLAWICFTLLAPIKHKTVLVFILQTMVILPFVILTLTALLKLFHRICRRFVMLKSVRRMLSYIIGITKGSSDDNLPRASCSTNHTRKSYGAII